MARASKHFFDAAQYAVVGASSKPEKFGNKVLRWYTARELPVKPVHPSERTIEGLAVASSLTALDLPPHAAGSLSVSVITPPDATLATLADAKALGIRHLWLQPGAEGSGADTRVKDWIEREGEGMQIVWGGDCILVLGDRLLDEARKSRM